MVSKIFLVLALAGLAVASDVVVLDKGKSLKWAQSKECFATVAPWLVGAYSLTRQ
jgi:hypothetical protein